MVNNLKSNSFKFSSIHLRLFLVRNPCAKFEVKTIPGPALLGSVRRNILILVGDIVRYVQTEDILHKAVSFADELHVSIFDAIMYHFDEVASTILTHPFATRLVVHLRTYCLNTTKYTK